ncbi:large ribosomal subunit protein uL13m-like [Halichondria panicea]|uniref:large ribosomal subunit protein uL13m-like n=1 Tax=Halichondria panicea TaxID=6063 RepID=UPI00312B8B32
MASKLSQSIATHTRLWYLIDARGQVVGRLGSMVSLLLQGKTKPIYHPAVDMGDNVVIINTRDIVYTGNKWKDKLFRHHTGYPGGLKEVAAWRLHEKDATQALRKAVNGMLPKNNLRKKRMRRLHLFPDSDHPYALNIYKVLEGPSAVYKKLDEYTKDEVQNFPEIVRVPHL